MFKLNAKSMQIRCSTHPVNLNEMATQYPCSVNGIYRPHWLVQWSCHCSHVYIPVHPPGLPGCTNVTQTTVVILTEAGLFPDRPCICMYLCVFYISIVSYTNKDFKEQCSSVYSWRMTWERCKHASLPGISSVLSLIWFSSFHYC